MNKEKTPDSVTVSFKDAVKFILLKSQKDGVSYSIPTYDELLIGISLGKAVPTGLEWTREGWIYNPKDQTVNKNPGQGETAGFRVILYTEPVKKKRQSNIKRRRKKRPRKLH